MKADDKFFYFFFVAIMYLHLCAHTFAQFLCTVNPNEYDHSMTITCEVVNELSTYFQEDITFFVFDGDQCVGTSYLPEFNFNGVGSLTPGMGYQIKLSEQINQFNFCL